MKKLGAEEQCIIDRKAVIKKAHKDMDGFSCSLAEHFADIRERTGHDSLKRRKIAAGARHISLRAKPNSKKANDWVLSGANKFPTNTGQAAIVAPASQTGLAIDFIVALCIPPCIERTHDRMRLAGLRRRYSR